MNRVLKANPNDGAALSVRGSAWFNLDAFEKALTDFTRVVDLLPDSASAHYDLGNALFMRKKYEEAVLEYTTAIDLDPGISDYYFNRALAGFYLDMATDACADLEKAASLGDEEAGAYLEEFCGQAEEVQ